MINLINFLQKSLNSRTTKVWLCRCLREESEVSVLTSELNLHPVSGVFQTSPRRYIYHDGIWDLRRGYECDDVRFLVGYPSELKSVVAWCIVS